MPSDARHKGVSEKSCEAKKVIKSEFLIIEERGRHVLVRSVRRILMVFFCKTAGRISCLFHQRKGNVR